ncbi:MAG: hypothetical protein WC823_06640 [Parcubacteria group bacterium]|jgi:hypothetical protein
MKIGIAEFRKMVHDLMFEQSQLDISNIGGIFCVKTIIEGEVFSCDITARDEQHAKCCLGF